MADDITTFTITTSGGTGDNMVWSIPAAANNGMQFVFVDDPEGDELETIRNEFAALAVKFSDNYFEDELYLDENWYEDLEANIGTFGEAAKYYRDTRIGALMNG